MPGYRIAIIGSERGRSFFFTLSASERYKARRLHVQEPPGGELSDFYNRSHGNAVIKMPNTRNFHRVNAEEKKDIWR